MGGGSYCPVVLILRYYGRVNPKTEKNLQSNPIYSDHGGLVFPQGSGGLPVAARQ